MDKFTRREFLLAGAIGFASIAIPGMKAFAAEKDGRPAYMSHIPLSPDSRTNKTNQEAMEKWQEAVKKARAQGSEIIEIKGSPAFAMPRLYTSPVATKRIGYFPYAAELAFNASYNATSGKRISDVYGVASYANWGCDAQQLASAYTKLDDGRTLSVSYTDLITWSPGTALAWRETIVSYAEFYYNGGCWAR